MENLSTSFCLIFDGIRHFSSLPYTPSGVPFLVQFNAGAPDIWNKTWRNVKSVAGTRTYWCTYRKTIQDRRWKPWSASCTVDSHLEESRGEKYHRLWVIFGVNGSKKDDFVSLYLFAVPRCFIKLGCCPTIESLLFIRKNTPILTLRFEFRIQGLEILVFRAARWLLNFHSYDRQWKPDTNFVQNDFAFNQNRRFFEVNNNVAQFAVH